jgi:hypothetical protein
MLMAAGVSTPQARSVDDLTDPIEIFKQADAAAKAVTTVRYDVHYRGLLVTERQVPEVTGSVLMSGLVERRARKFYCEGEVRNPGSSEEQKVTVGTDGNTYFLLDHRLNRGYVGVGPAITGSTGRPVERLMLLEFVIGTPFTDEINGRSHTYRGTTRIGGEECYEVAVTYANSGLDAVWSFSKKDFLPRRVQRYRIMLSGERGGEEWTLTNLVADPEPAEDAFAFRLPQGFSRIEGFAP